MSGSGDRSRTGLTPATRLRLIWTETLVKCGLGATAREISPTSCGPGSYGRARNCVSKIRINCRANREDCNLTLGNVNWATLYSLQSWLLYACLLHLGLSYSFEPFPRKQVFNEHLSFTLSTKSQNSHNKTHYSKNKECHHWTHCEISSPPLILSL